MRLGSHISPTASRQAYICTPMSSVQLDMGMHGADSSRLLYKGSTYCLHGTKCGFKAFIIRSFDIVLLLSSSFLIFIQKLRLPQTHYITFLRTSLLDQNGFHRDCQRCLQLRANQRLPPTKLIPNFQFSLPLPKLQSIKWLTVSPPLQIQLSRSH